MLRKFGFTLAIAATLAAWSGQSRAADLPSSLNYWLNASQRDDWRSQFCLLRRVWFSGRLLVRLRHLFQGRRRQKLGRNPKGHPPSKASSHRIANNGQEAFDRWWEWIEKPADSPLTIPAYLHDAVTQLSPEQRLNRVVVNEAVPPRRCRCATIVLTGTLPVWILTFDNWTLPQALTGSFETVNRIGDGGPAHGCTLILPDRMGAPRINATPSSTAHRDSSAHRAIIVFGSPPG